MTTENIVPIGDERTTEDTETYVPGGDGRNPGPKTSEVPYGDGRSGPREGVERYNPLRFWRSVASPGAWKWPGEG
ncbi:hypothetical protein NDU88_002750 [Pleurodeles waltl]|uniref:Uncharacterized protein n=1 Tax=Pleurodeles waltl TaxID=8319 RepID=A0AAV7TMM5_PLEWA|nr:hypothetical protein NDU88_002750 [Pleurodeles waltl]